MRRNLAEQEAIVEEKKRSSSINDLSSFGGLSADQDLQISSFDFTIGRSASSGYRTGNHGWIKGIISVAKRQRWSYAQNSAYGDLSVLCYPILSIQNG